MTLGIYKPSQGYWVRVMTATMIAVATMAFAGWLWGQAAVVATKLPIHSYEVALVGAKNDPGAGQIIDLLKSAETGASDLKIGTARIDAYDRNSSQITISDIRMLPGAEPKATAEVKAQNGPFEAKVVSRGVSEVRMVEPVMLQGSVAAVVLLLGAIIAWYFCAMHPRTVEFLISTDMEMKKVNWSSAKDIRGSTLLVITASFLLAGALFAVDYGFQAFFRAIGVLAS